MYFRVDAGTLQVGVLNLNWDTLPTGFEVQELLALDLPAEEGIRRQLLLTETVTSRALTLQSVQRSLSTGTGTEDVRLSLPADSIQRYFIGGDGDRAGSANIRVQGPRPTHAAVLPLRLAFAGRLAVGEVIDEQVADLERRGSERVRGRVSRDSVFIFPDSVEFDTLAIRWRTITMDTVRAWRVDLELGGLPEAWWVDDRGRLVRLETPFGITLQRAPFDYSHTLYRDSLRVSGPVPRLVLTGLRSVLGTGTALDTAARTMRLALSRVDRALTPEVVAVLGGGAQTVEGTVVTTRRGWPTDSGAPPDRYRTHPGAPEPTTRVQLMADSAFAGAATAQDSVILLTRWTHRRAADDTAGMGGGPAPVEGRADAAARTLVTLARVGGLAARVVNGLAVTAAGLLSHTWAEVWIGGGWVPVDPSFGHAPASARLLRITDGGMGRPFETLVRTAALRVEPMAPEGR
ncbi:MAG: hypothetical protein M3N43_13205, partial [Actinomycetota bacterium]|nr:hypothetical protein [Actinomycetota bacterium]